MTIINISRTFKLSNIDKPKLIPDYNSIEEPSGMNKIIPSGFINEFVRTYKLNCNKPDLGKLYLSNKAGPVGPSTLTAQDSMCYHNYYVLQLLMNLTGNLGIEYITKQFNLAWNLMDKSLHVSKHTGKLSFIFDPECKLRIVAIVDYYTQLFLRPIHNDLMILIKRLPCDRTYTQDPMHN